jgi:hypothetical protein
MAKTTGLGNITKFLTMMPKKCKQNINIVGRISGKRNMTHITSSFRITKLLFVFGIAIAIGGFSAPKAVAQSGSKLVELCNSVAGDDATYLKDFYVELDAAGPEGKAPEQRFTIVLSKNTEYRFTVCNAEGSQGKAILQLYDVSKLYASTYNPQTGQTFQSFNFQCQKTGAYHLIVSFLDGKKGSAVVIASFVRTL